ncbi:MAG: hydrogenase nickel incorporation protein HypB [candidate division WOR-3 bacterium]
MGEIKFEDISIPLLKANEAIAKKLREKWDREKTFVINFISSAGSGKTTLIEKILPYFKNFKIIVLTGDIETQRDAERIRNKGFEAVQIITGGACHLEAVMIEEVIDKLKNRYDFIFVENVGNLVCPSVYELGENLRFTLLSVPEGDDKPKKYPKAFLTSKGFIITKIDLIPYIPFNIENVKKEALEINPSLKIFETSALKNIGIEEVVKFIKEEREKWIKEF